MPFKSKSNFKPQGMPPVMERLPFEDVHLSVLPEKLERCIKFPTEVLHVAASATNSATKILIVGTADGCVYFYQIDNSLIEYAKVIKDADGPTKGLSVSLDGWLCCSMTNSSISVFDLHALDMMCILKPSYKPGVVQWVYKPGAGKSRLAISNRLTGSVGVFDARNGSTEPLVSRKIHGTPVRALAYNHAFDSIVSADSNGMLAYWDPYTLKSSDKGLDFKFSIDTDLFMIAKNNTLVSSIEVSADGTWFSTVSLDGMIRVFQYRTGKICRVYKESIYKTVENYPEWRTCVNIGKKGEVEKDVIIVPQPHAVFDESSNFIMYPSVQGIKIVNLITNAVVRVLGRVGNNLPFLRIALYQGGGFRERMKFRVDQEKGSGETWETIKLTYPFLACTSNNNCGLFLFSRLEDTGSSTKVVAASRLIRSL